jgi:hypothetical protein
LFFAPIDGSFTTNLAAGGGLDEKCENESLFPTLDYKTNGVSDGSISRGTDTLALAFMANPIENVVPNASTTTNNSTTLG